MNPEGKVGREGDGSWLSVDLGEITRVNRWLVVYEKGGNQAYSQFFTNNFSLEASNDNINWKVVDNVSNNTAGITNRYLPYTVQARYFRLKINIADSDGIARIYEFQLYND